MAAVTHAHPAPALYLHTVRRALAHSTPLPRTEHLVADPLARAVLAGTLAEPATVRVAVLSLFHPRLLEVTGQAQTLSVRWIPGDRMEVAGPGEERHELSTLTLPKGRFLLHVAGRHTDLHRTYQGTLTLTVSGGELHAVVGMETELAVVSVVAAEAPAGAGPAVLQAQAIAARSFLLSNLHPDAAADTCDTTHCQLLQGVPASGSPAWRAALATRHQVLVWRPAPGSGPYLVAARWTASCPGHTLAGHPHDSSEYPFYPVACVACRSHPDRWQMPPGAPVPVSEAARERWNRDHPESQVPSVSVMAGSISGQGRGHGVGLCQRGAVALATEGRTAGEILAHYFPTRR